MYGAAGPCLPLSSANMFKILFLTDHSFKLNGETLLTQFLVIANFCIILL